MPARTLAWHILGRRNDREGRIPTQVMRLHEQEGQETFAIVFSAGEEAVSGLLWLAKSRKLSSAHFTGIGALSAATVGFFQIERQKYREIDIAEQVEVLALTGNIALDQGEPKVHAHIVVGRLDGSTLGGHLLSAQVRPTLEIVMIESPRHLRRKFDPASGLALLDFAPDSADSD
jgi:predicted DNA-binding protein with PD1-like motif